MAVTTTNTIKQEISLSKGVLDTKENSIAKLFLTKVKKVNTVDVTTQEITPRQGEKAGEGSNYSGTYIDSVRKPIKNTCMIYNDLIKISRTAMLTDPFGAKKEIESAIEGYKNYLEDLIINGGTVEGRTTKGLKDYVPTKNKTTIPVGTELSGIVLSAALKNSSKNANFCFCGYNFALKLDALVKQNNADNWNNHFSGMIDYISVRNAKNCAIIVTDAVGDNEALFLNDAYVELDSLTLAEVKKAEGLFDGTMKTVTDESCVLPTLTTSLSLVTLATE